MKKIMLALAAAAVLASCGNHNNDDIQVISNFYDAVLGKTEMTDALLEKTLSKDILESLWEEEYIGSYSFWKFRTGFQDGPSRKSRVEDIQPLGDGWYQVSYQDLGIPGVTSVKLEQGKITDYRPFWVTYTLAHNYFRRNDVEDVLPVKITSEEELLRFFGYAAFMGRNGEPTKIDFDKSFVIPIILPETDLETEIIIDGLYHSRPDQLTLAFSAVRGEEPMTYTIAPFQLLIVDAIYRDSRIVFDTTESPYSTE